MLSDRAPADVVVIDPAAGRTHSADHLRALGARFARLLPRGRKLLVELAARRSIETVAIYIECLGSGHAVALVDPRHGSGRRTAARDALRPDVIVDAEAIAAVGSGYDDYAIVGTLGAAAVRCRRRHEGPSIPPAVALLLATSGSLGAFRFVCLSHTNLTSNAGAIAAVLGLSPDDCGATSLPLSFSYGLSVLNSHLLAGARLALVDAPPTGREFWRHFDDAGCTSFAGVPEMYRLLQAGGHSLTVHPTLRLATSSGSRLPEPLALALAADLARTGGELALMYGQTEATARIACQRGPDVLRWPGSVGRALPGGRVWIEAAGGAGPPEGEPGEVVFAGPSIMHGYARDRAELSEVPSEPPATLHTGDVGRLVDGRLHLQGRLSRVAKPLGVRVQLEDVEAAFLAAGPAAAVAGPDEVVRVYVEGAPAEYRAPYREVLGSYGLPPSAVRVVGVDRIPRTASGKFAYAELPET